MKGLENYLLDKELKAQIDIANKQYQKLDNIYEFNKITKKYQHLKSTFRKYNRSNLIYISKYSFYESYNINFNSLSLTSKYKVFNLFL